LGRSTEYTKYSKIILKDGLNTYPAATNAGNEGGMEYPGIVFVVGNLKEKI
jgi:hypothetical protein